jgi:hypothetical protein
LNLRPFAPRNQPKSANIELSIGGGHVVISFRWFLCGQARLIIFFVLNLLTVSSATAYCPRFPIAPNSEFFKSKFVVLGTVASVQIRNDDEGFLESTTYLIKVEKTFRGRPGAFLKTYSENDSGRFEMDKGQTYLLFITTSENHLVVNNCGSSGPSSEAQATAALEAIARIATSGPSGEIEGNIRPAPRIELSGIRVVATSGKKHYVAYASTDGWFHLRVPAGNYRLRVDSTDSAIISPYDLNVDDPDHFTIYPGGSVHLEYDAR